MFTKRHYEAIADFLREIGADDRIVEKFAKFFEEDNPKFSVAKFRRRVYFGRVDLLVGRR